MRFSGFHHQQAGAAILLHARQERMASLVPGTASRATTIDHHLRSMNGQTPVLPRPRRADVTELERSPEDERTLPIILIAAVVQGWSLYGLHMSIEGKGWLASHPEWLLPLYALATLVPLTVQMLAGSVRQPI